MKIALVHDYLKDFGGAERVLLALSEIYPKAPIYTAFFSQNSPTHEAFKGKRIIESQFAPILKPWRLYSPLRFLLPWIWGSMDLSKYDLVITSCSNYIARGFKVSKKTKVIAYCHTPPRFLYGFKTGFDWKKHWIIRVYGQLVSHFLRMFDYESAQKVDYWIANSENVRARIQKFYRKDAIVIYPPVETKKLIKASEETKKQGYFLIVARLVGSKGLEEAIVAANELKIPLKVVGDAQGFISVSKKLQKMGKKNVEFLGRVPDGELWNLYAQARGFIALARDEDFGMTVVEAQAAGTPVIAYNGGGFRESVVDGKTGILINRTDKKAIEQAIARFNKIKWDKQAIVNHAKSFGKERFKKQIKNYIKEKYEEKVIKIILM
jgi:glycosyltransferase involved in cell wall biosynthesis